MTVTQTRTRVAVPLVWAAAMLAARIVDPWIPIAIAALAMSAAVLATDRVLLRELFRPSFRSVLFGLLGAAAMTGATYALFPILALAVPALGERTRDLYAMFLAGRPTVSVLLYVVPIICAEEILWRGAFQEWAGLRIPSRPIVIAIVSAAIYAISHAPSGSLLLVLVAFACGLFWSSLRGLSHSLIPSLVAHLTWDLALILVPLHQ